MNIAKHMHRTYVVVATVFVLCAPGLSRAQVAGEVICAATGRFLDGDTFACAGPEQTLKIRVAGIHAPEVSQGF